MNGTSQVNFLRQRRKLVTATVQRDRVIARYASIALIIFMVVLVGVVVAHALLNRQQESLDTQISATRRTLQSLASFEKQYVTFVRKVKLLYALDLQREIKQKAANFFYALVPRDDVLVAASIDEDKNQIVFQVESPDVFRALTLLQMFQGENLQKEGYILTIETLERKAGGIYTFSGALNFNALMVKK